MALKNISVLVGTSKASGRRLDYAAALATRHDAHVCGLGLVGSFDLPGYMSVNVGAEVARIIRSRADEREAETRAAFDEAMRRNGLTDRTEWRAMKGDPTEGVRDYTRYTDLLLVGQDDPDDPEPVWIDTEDLLISCGRPLMFVPYAFRQAAVGRHVLIAWNATREAGRAVADAMPILTEAEKVTIFSVNPTRSLGDTPGSTIAAHLAHHGIRAETLTTQVRDLDVADVILSRAADLDVDTLVMGAYGHSRLRESVLGGVTRDILRHMTVPVLMSH